MPDETNVSIASYIYNITTDYKSGNSNKFNLLKLLIDRSTELIKAIPTSISTRHKIEKVLQTKSHIVDNIEKEIQKYTLIKQTKNNVNKYDTHNYNTTIYIIIYYIAILFIILFELYIFFIYIL